MEFIATNKKDENIEIAKKILNNLGVLDITFSGYSDTNGISVYFKNSKGVKCRVSDHSTTNRDRMNNELNVSFDSRLIGLGGKISIKNNFAINKLIIKRFNY